jgi:general secretion pathway protein D
MAMISNKSWSVFIIMAAALLLGSLSSAAWTAQRQARSPTSENERKQMVERLRKQLQATRKAATRSPAAASQQPKPAPPAPAPANAPEAPPAPAPTAQPTPSTLQRASEKVRLNYENADLYDFINQIASTLGITPIVIDPDVKGTVNILSTAPMSKEDIFPLFSLILKNNNAALIKDGDVYQIVPISSALKRGVEIIEKLPEPGSGRAPANPKAAGPTVGQGASSPIFNVFRQLAAKENAARKTPAASPASSPEPSTDSGPARLATHVIRVEFVPVKDLIEPIKLLMTEGGVIMPYERLNMLILTDYTDNADRILKIIHMLDDNYLDPNLIDLIKIENNASADVAEDLKKIFGNGSKDAATGISFVSLDRINAIFVIASSKRGLEEVKRWIKELDAASGRNIQTYVYVVQNSTASNIAMMLSALYGGEGSSSPAESGTAGSAGTGGTAFGGNRNAQAGGTFGTSGSTFSNPNQAGSNTGMFGGQGGYGNQSYGAGGFGGGFMGGGAFTTGQRLGPQLNVSRTVTSQILKGGEFTGLQDTVRMVVDDINNSLIIQATAADYAYISETIKKMDVLPRQAIIDARVFEVDLTNNLNYGVNAILQGRTDTASDHQTGGNINWGDSVGLSANTFAFVGDTREILMRLNALRLKTKVRILEAPSVLALDGTMASIIVGAEVPYPGGSYTSSAGGSTTSVQYRETGISLLVMPRISASGSVTLDITQEVSSPGASVNLGSAENAPTFSLSRVMTTLSVKDGETVAIAGLIRDSNDFSRTGVPFLSDIPILGNLFGQTSRNSRRTELIILITPHVIRTVEGFQEMTQELKDSLRNVRKLADEKEREHIQDMEDAREDRYKQEQKRVEEKK